MSEESHFTSTLDNRAPVKRVLQPTGKPRFNLPHTPEEEDDGEEQSRSR